MKQMPMRIIRKTKLLVVLANFSFCAVINEAYSKRTMMDGPTEWPPRLLRGKSTVEK
jgi:hypothetical protein